MVKNATRGSVLALSASLACLGLTDSVTVNVHPYWTGTFNVASGTAIGGPFIAYELIVDGTTVKSAQFEDGAMQHITASAIIDSTHFEHGTGVPVTFRVKNETTGLWQEETGIEIVKNKAAAFNLWDFTFIRGGLSSTVVKAHADAMNWETFERHTYGWDGTSLSTALTGAGVWYIHSHGIPNHHQVDDGGASIDMYADSPSASTDYLRLRQSINGTGTPPYNSTGNPQVSLAVIDSCDSGFNNHFGVLLYPYLIYTSMFVMNQAVFSWADSCYIGDAYNRNNVFWGFLRDRLTVSRAREELIAANLSGTAFMYTTAAHRPVNSPADIPIWGDHYTRIHGVYTGSNAQASGVWYL